MLDPDVILIKKLLFCFEEYFEGRLELFPDFFHYGEFEVLYTLALNSNADSDRFNRYQNRITIEHGDVLIIFRPDGLSDERVVKIDVTESTGELIIGSNKMEFDSWFRNGEGRKAILIRKRK